MSLPDALPHLSPNPLSIPPHDTNPTQLIASTPNINFPKTTHLPPPTCYSGIREPDSRKRGTATRCASSLARALSQLNTLRPYSRHSPKIDVLGREPAALD